MTEQLPEIVKAFLSRYPCAGHRWLGYSGGLDSTVLLHILAGLEIPVRAIHIHHDLSPHADDWQARCIESAESLGVPIVTRRVMVAADDGGLEQGARRARYQAFAELLGAGDQLLLAQHGDDQVETFLLRLLRGAGVRGLAAMPEWRPLVEGASDNAVLARPLLGVGRDQLEAFARDCGLRWIEDESNSDLAFDRNYLRARVIPELSTRWPVRERVARAVDNLREAADLLQDLGMADLSGCDWRGERFGESVDLELLQQLPRRRQKNLLRSWLRRTGDDMPPARQLDESLAQALDAAEDSELAVSLGERVVRRFRKRLYLTPQLPAVPEAEEWHWRGDRVLDLGQGWELRPQPDWPPGDYRVCFRRGGERARPVGRCHSQTLKKLLQEYHLEPWLRDRIPLIYRAGEPESLLAAGDLFRCEERLPAALEWQFGDPKTAI